MRLAFYAPLKPPDHPVPSGDRRMAQLLIQAWEQAGHQVEIASRLASRRGEGAQQKEVAVAAAAERERLLALYAARAPADRPAAWFTYHLYYKAPDWLGPDLARALAIPYLVAEASVAGKRAGGPHALGHDATAAALRAAGAGLRHQPGGPGRAGASGGPVPSPGRAAGLPRSGGFQPPGRKPGGGAQDDGRAPRAGRRQTLAADRCHDAPR